MGASAQPSASGMPPKTSGWRTRVRVSVGAVGDGARSDTGAPGDLRGRRASGKEARKSLGRPSGRDAFTGGRLARTGDVRRHGGRQSLERVRGEDATGGL